MLQPKMIVEALDLDVVSQRLTKLEEYDPDINQCGIAFHVSSLYRNPACPKASDGPRISSNVSSNGELWAIYLT